MTEVQHDSDCAQHNEPAYPNGPCDCSVSRLPAKPEGKGAPVEADVTASLDYLAETIRLLSAPGSVKGPLYSRIATAGWHVKGLRATLSASADQSGPTLTVEAAWQELLEVEDRTSPEDWPDMLLITQEELAGFMNRAAPADQSGVIGALVLRLIEDYGAESFERAPDDARVWIGGWSTYSGEKDASLVHVGDLRQALAAHAASTGGPELWQRLSASGWVTVDQEDIPHYRDRGQKIRALGVVAISSSPDGEQK